MAEKILIGIPTYAKGQYCLRYLLDAIEDLIKGFDVKLLFVDTSDFNGYDKVLEKAAKDKNIPVDVVRDPANKKKMYDIITSARNKVKNYLLKHNFDYLLFFDHDVIAPPHTLKTLLEDNKDVVSGMYLLGTEREGKKEVRPDIFVHHEGEFVRMLSVREVLGDALIPIAASGLGCALIKRKVLENITFRTEKGSSEDVIFFTDAAEQGFKFYADTTVECTHMKFPAGDRNNLLYSFDYHKKKYGFQ